MRSNISFFWVLLCTLMLSACTADKPTGTQAKALQTYTCPMHPQIVQHEMSTCPLCGMDLVLIDKNDQSASLTLSKNQEILANIKVRRINGAEVLDEGIRINGRLVNDPADASMISARAEGRLNKLFVKTLGMPIQKGQALYQIYSEELLALQQEFLMTQAQAASFPGNAQFKALNDAAAQKLLRYGQTKSQLLQLVQKNKTNAYVTFVAPHSGMLRELLVSEGAYVSEGMPLFKLESYEQIWVEAEVYPQELQALKKGQMVPLSVQGFEQERLHMKIEFMAPGLSMDKQTVNIRGSIANKGQKFQPGMLAHLYLQGKSSPNNKLMLPLDAIIQDGHTAHLWVKTAPGKYEPRKVSLGEANAHEVEVLAGLDAQSEVVISGAYLLYSEYILKKGKHPITL